MVAGGLPGTFVEQDLVRITTDMLKIGVILIPRHMAPLIPQLVNNMLSLKRAT